MGGPYSNEMDSERHQPVRGTIEDMRRHPVNEFADKSDRVTLNDRMSRLEQTIHETHKLIELLDEQIQFTLKPSYPRDDVNKAVSGTPPDVSPLCRDIDAMTELSEKGNRYLDELIRRLDV